jgi:protein translocase SecG subunit
MMIVIGLLTAILVLDCLLLMLLVLVQLPKKEAGMGQAFGGAATDALFGSGSGNALTKMTQYATAIFFILTLTISIMFNINSRNRGSGFERSLGKSTPAADLPVTVPSKTLPTPAAANTALTSASNAAANPATATGSAVTNAASKAVTPTAPANTPTTK